MTVRKAFLIFSVAFFITASRSAKAQAVACDSVYTLAEQMPYYGKGQRDFFTYLNKTLDVKKPCKSSDLKRILFTITKDGKIDDIEVVGVTGKCKDDLIAQLKNFPDWNPGKDQGQPVCVRVILPIQLKDHKEPGKTR